MKQQTQQDGLASLAARIRDQLAQSCPGLSAETRSVFAIQIAIAESRVAMDRDVSRELGWLHDLN
jgi:hypothetical protein